MKLKILIKSILLILTIIISFSIVKRHNKSLNVHLSDSKLLSRISDLSSIKKGEYLVEAGDCTACHTINNSEKFAGGLDMKTPFGTIYTPNITSDDEYGIGKWTKDDFYKAMHLGISKNGSFLYPVFPFMNYTKITRDDVDSIYNYLRSVPKVHIKNKKNELFFPFNHRILLFMWRILFFKEGEYKKNLKETDVWNRGSYLVEGLGHCGMCHTPMNIIGGPINSLKFSGGLIPIQNWYAPSLTSDKEYGLGDWSIDDLSNFLKNGVSKNSSVFGPMSDVVYHSLQYMTNDDIKSITTYLKSLPKKNKYIENINYEVSDKFGCELFNKGKNIYLKFCEECHMNNGKGISNIFPSLVNNNSINMSSPVNLIKMILNGGYTPCTFDNKYPYGMPPFFNDLNDEEIAAVSTYIRKEWNNQNNAVSPKQVFDLRSL